MLKVLGEENPANTDLTKGDLKVSSNPFFFFKESKNIDGIEHGSTNKWKELWACRKIFENTNKSDPGAQTIMLRQ